MIKINKKQFNKEFEKTHLKCTFDLEVYFDEKNATIVYKTKKIYKLLITLILPLYYLFYVFLFGIVSTKVFYCWYFNMIKKEIHSTLHIVPEEKYFSDWICESMCKILNVEKIEIKED